MFTESDLIARIERFITSKRMTPTAFGRKVANDSMLLTDLKDGRELRRKTRAKIEAFIGEEERQPDPPKRKRPMGDA